MLAPGCQAGDRLCVFLGGRTPQEGPLNARSPAGARGTQEVEGRSLQALPAACMSLLVGRAHTPPFLQNSKGARWVGRVG